MILSVLLMGALHADESVSASVALPTLAVMKPTASAELSQEPELVAEAVASRLQQSGVVRVLERGQMSQILQEQSFQQSGACDQGECAVEVGRMLGVQRMVVGTMGRMGETWTLNLRIVDVSSGEILRSSSRQARGDIDGVLTKLVPKVADDLLGRTSHAWAWWAVGGIALCGGTTAAVILLQDGESSADPGATPAEVGQARPITVRW